MGCACNKKINPKYLEEGEEEEKETGIAKVVNTVFQVFAQILYGIIISAILVVVLIPLLLYIFFCLLTGKEAHVRIPRINKASKK